MGHRPCVVWFTGLSGAGKSTIAETLQGLLARVDCSSVVLDGDRVRAGLCRDLDYSPNGRSENVRRVAEVAQLINEAGLIALVSLISPLRSHRDQARALVAAEFIEVFVDIPLAIAESTDAKGLYRRARLGDLPDLTGVGSPYEPPDAPDLHLRMQHLSPADAAQIVVDHLRARGMTSQRS